MNYNKVSLNEITSFKEQVFTKHLSSCQELDSESQVSFAKGKINLTLCLVSHDFSAAMCRSWCQLLSLSRL